MGVYVGRGTCKEHTIPVVKKVASFHKFLTNFYPIFTPIQFIHFIDLLQIVSLVYLGVWRQQSIKRSSISVLFLKTLQNFTSGINKIFSFKFFTICFLGIKSFLPYGGIGLQMTKINWFLFLKKVNAYNLRIVGLQLIVSLKIHINNLNYQENIALLLSWLRKNTILISWINWSRYFQ